MNYQLQKKRQMNNIERKKEKGEIFCEKKEQDLEKILYEIVVGKKKIKKSEKLIQNGKKKKCNKLERKPQDFLD